jgi:O-antigen ligase
MLTKNVKAKRTGAAPTGRRIVSEWLRRHWLSLALSIFFVVLPFIGGASAISADWLLLGVVSAALLAAATIGVAVALWRRQPLMPTLPEVFLWAFVAWQWAMVSISVYRWASWTEAVRWTAFAVVVIAMRWAASETQRVKAESLPLLPAVAFVVGAILSALQGIAEYAVNAAAGNPSWRIFGPFLNPNLFANYLLLAFFVAVGLAIAHFRRAPLALSLLTLLLLTAMGLTGSKGALLAWLMGTMALGLMAMGQLKTVGVPDRRHRFVRRWMIPMALLVGLLICALAVAILPPIKARFFALWTTQAHSWMFRWLIWKATLMASLARPLTGFGAGTFEWVYPQFATVSYTRHAHSGFLQVAMESGWLGLTLLLLCFASALICAAKMSLAANLPPTESDQPTGQRHWLRMASAAAFIAFCVHNAVETAWLTTANLLALAFVVGLLQSEISPLRRLSWRWWGLVLPFLLIGLWHSVGVARGASFAQLARNEPLPSVRLFWLERASDADPLNARYLIDRAILLEAWAKATGDENRLGEALRLCDAAIRLQPTRSGNYKVKARLLQSLGDEAGAEKALRTALRFNRTDTEAMLRLGELLEKKQPDAAAAIYRRLVSLERSPYGRFKPIEQWQDIFLAAGKIRLARHLWRQGQRQRAQQLLDEAERTLRSFQSAYLPILKASDPEAAESQDAFVHLLLDDLHLLRQTWQKAPQNVGR